MLYRINPSAATPIYRQIVEEVRCLVAAGRLQPGDELPSVRSVAREQAINPMTVSKAYSLLEEQGVVVRQRGQAMAIAPQPSQASSMEDRLKLLRPSLEAAARHAHQLGIPAAAALTEFRIELQADQP